MIVFIGRRVDSLLGLRSQVRNISEGCDGVLNNSLRAPPQDRSPGLPH